MSDRIEPALNRDDWLRLPGVADLIREACASPDGVLALSLASATESGDIEFDRSTRGILSLMAALNAALDDDDPRKITRHRIDWLRALDEKLPHVDRGYLSAMAAALESYLPPP